MAQKKADLENAIQRALTGSLRKTNPQLFETLVTLVNSGETKQAIMSQVKRIAGNISLTTGSIEATIDTLLDEKRNAIDADKVN